MKRAPGLPFLDRMQWITLAGAIQEAGPTVTCVEEAENVMAPHGEGEGSDADAEDIAAEDTDFSSAVDHVLHNMPVTDTWNGF